MWSERPHLVKTFVMETHDRIELDRYNVDVSSQGNGPLKRKTPLKIGTWNIGSLYRMGYAKYLFSVGPRCNSIAGDKMD